MWKVPRHRFEAICTGGTETSDMGLHASWAAGFMRKLGDLNILIAGEVDGTTNRKFLYHRLIEMR